MDERYGAERSQLVADVTWIQDLADSETAVTSDRHPLSRSVQQ